MRGLLVLVVVALLLWLGGLGVFAMLLPQPRKVTTATDAVVALTGGPGRVAHAVDVLAHKQARQLFVSGVNPAASGSDIERHQNIPKAMLACCVTLGKTADDTIGNARETAEWAQARKIGSIRLVTSDQHMPRAALELRAAMPDVEILPDPVPSAGAFPVLVSEYNKFLLRWLVIRLSAPAPPATGAGAS